MPGVGLPTAKLMLVVEYPRKGKFFSERFRELLVQTLAKADIGGKEVYATSLVKCQTPGRIPTVQEYDNCKGYFSQEIHLIQPKVIVGFGNYVANKLRHELSRHTISDIAGSIEDASWFPCKVGYWYNEAYMMHRPGLLWKFDKFMQEVKRYM
jgi:uracil-DNA glycosylase family 4